MKVLHAAETIKGGVATIVRQLMQAQNEELGQANVMALVPDCHAAELATLPQSQIHTFHRTGRNLMSYLRCGYRFARLVLREKPDVVHLHSTFAGIICRPIVWLLWPLARPKVIYSPHAWAFLMDIPTPRKRLYAWIERFLAHSTHGIICGSLYEATQARAYGLPNAKLHTVLSGVNIPEIKPSTAPADLKPAALNILFVGRFDHQKGFDILSTTMGQLLGHAVHLTAVGEAVHGKQNPPASANISYVGWLTPQQLAQYFSHADVLVMPSRWESFGLVAAEAAAYGLPVIASRSCSLPEIIRHGETGLLFTPESTDELTSLIINTPAATWKSMRNAARAHYLANLTASRMTSQTAALYKAIMA